MMNKKILPAMGLAAMTAIGLGIANADCPNGYSTLDFNKQSFSDQQSCEKGATDTLKEKYEDQYGLAPLSPNNPRCTKKGLRWVGCYRKDIKMETKSMKASNCEGKLGDAFKTEELCKKNSKKETALENKLVTFKECVEVAGSWHGCYQNICKGRLFDDKFDSKELCELKSPKGGSFKGSVAERVECVKVKDKWHGCYQEIGCKGIINDNVFYNAKELCESKSRESIKFKDKALNRTGCVKYLGNWHACYAPK